MSWRSVTQRLLVLPAVLCATAALRGAEEPTSENNEQLKRALARYPDTDANHDGVLTRTEAQAYIRTHPEVAPKKAAKEDRGGRCRGYRGSPALPMLRLRARGDTRGRR